jgi:N-acetylglucosaminyldiphosphoundecaprenol N-acetyl-beta-D-mannosaminyltransferase
MNMSEFWANRFIRNFIKDKWLIFASTAVLMGFAIAYVTFVYKAPWLSEAKVWIKDTATRSFVSPDNGEPGYLSSLTASGNPSMIQSEILMSQEMEHHLSDYIKRTQPREKWGGLNAEGGPDTHGIVKVKTEPNTDLLTIKLKWENPAMSQDLLREALAKLDETNLTINRQIYTKKRVYLQKQLQDIEGKLQAVRQRIKDFQSGNLMVDMESQTSELVKLRSQLVQQLESAMASRNNVAGNARALQNQLSMSPRDALAAVALGSGNTNLVKMRTDLATLKQQYAHDSVKESDTNPHLVALKGQIDALEAQIREETRQTAGRNTHKGPMIFDNVRGELVQDMASSQAKSVALGAEVSSLTAAISRVDQALRNIPKNRFTLSGLQEEERALSLAFDEMRKREIEASIKEAETPSNVFIVDAPSLPHRASFPTATHLLALSLLLGVGASMGLSVLKTLAEDVCEGAEAVSETTKAKVLGVVPWITDPVIPRSDEESMFSHNDVACKHIISNLRMEAVRQEAQVVAFTSTSLSKPKSSGAHHLAQCMAAVGHTVVFLDADLRNSSAENPTSGMELSDLILDVDLKLRSGQPVFPEDILSSLARDEKGIYTSVNRNAMSNAFDYFSSKGFRHIVNVLKEQFEWVFINTPPASIAPEFLPIANTSDGVIVFVDKQATYSTLRTIVNRVQEAQVPLLGTIVREQNGRIEWEHEMYNNWRGPGRGGGMPVTAGSGSRTGKKRVEFMGAKIDALTMQETLDYVSEAIKNRQNVQHVVVNVAKLMTMRRDRKLREIVNGCDLINADGAGVVLGARMLGINIPERVAGIDLMNRLVEQANRYDYRIFFLGAEEGIVRDVLTHYRNMYPNLQICGYQNGYFRPEEEATVANKIRQAKPDILFVAMSSPKKEKFISQFKEQMNVPFVMGVGGSFDVVAGKVKRAPQWMQDSGMEWFYRLIQEPGRMWKRYLVTNLEFGFALANQAMTMRLRNANG